MSSAELTRRLRTLARWLLLIIALGYIGWTTFTETGASPDVQFVDEDPDDDDKLKIEYIKPAEVASGNAVVLTVTGVDETPEVRVTIDKEQAEVLDRTGGQVVVRVPDGTQDGRAKVRVLQDDRRSKSRDLWVKGISERKMFRNLLGGLALFVLGLRTLSRGLRGYAGRSLRRLLERVAQGRWRGFGVGALVGGVTQSPVTAAGLLVGLVDSKLLGWGAALAALLGAQLGASAMAVVLPFGATRDALIVVAVGVGWVALANDRRSRALSKAVLGLGLLFYGLQLLSIGFQPLDADPELLPYASSFRQPGLSGVLAATFAGTVLSTAIPAPGPVFAVVLGLGQSSGLIGPRESLALLAGLPLGAAIWTALVAWPFGGSSRKLAKTQLVLGAMLTFGLAATIPLWMWLSDSIVPGDPTLIEYGKKVLYPNLGAHLAVALVLSQAAFLALGCIPVFRLQAWLDNRPKQAPLSQANPERAGRQRLVTICAGLGQALDSTRDMLATGERGNSTQIESTLEELRGELAVLLASLPPNLHNSLKAVTLSLSAARQSLLSLQHTVERGIEQDTALQPAAAQALEELYQLVRRALENLQIALLSDDDEEVEQARALEIHINAQELKARSQVIESSDSGQTWVDHALYATAAAAAYEELGNHLFQAHEAIAAELDDTDY